MKKLNIPMEFVIVSFIFVFIGIGIYSYITYITSQSEETEVNRIPSQLQSNCTIEYGSMVCIKEKPRIPFFNPNDVDLENIRVIVPKSNGIDIYQVKEPLFVNDTQVLTLKYHDCSVIKRIKGLSVKWCCGDSDCYNSSLDFPTDMLTVKLNESF